jgi:hypothetical protein
VSSLRDCLILECLCKNSERATVDSPRGDRRLVSKFCRAFSDTRQVLHVADLNEMRDDPAELKRNFEGFSKALAPPVRSSGGLCSRHSLLFLPARDRADQRGCPYWPQISSPVGRPVRFTGGNSEHP